MQKASHDCVLPVFVLRWEQLLIDWRIPRLVYLRVGRACEREAQLLAEVILYVEVVSPEEVLANRQQRVVWVFVVYASACQITLLLFLVLAPQCRRVIDRRRQIIDIYVLDNTEHRLTQRLEFLERFPRLRLNIVLVHERSLVVSCDAAQHVRVMLVGLGVGITQREVRRVVRHRELLALDVHFEVRYVEALGCVHSLGEVFERISLVSCLQCLKAFLEQKVCVRRVILRLRNLLSVSIINRNADLGFLWEELAELSVRRDIELSVIVHSAVLYIVLDAAKSGSLHTSSHIHAGEVGKVQCGVTHGSPTAVLIETGHSQLIDPDFS